MRLIREVTENVPQPVLPEEGWNVGHLAHHGILLSCDGFAIKLDLDQLNILFDYAEDGTGGEVRDHDGEIVYVEVNDSNIVLSRDDDKTYPNGVIIDTDTLKEMGIEAHDDATSGDNQPAEEPPKDAKGDTIIPKAGEAPPDESEEEVEDELEEGIKRAYKRVGNKIKRGFRVTSGWRKGRVVSSAKGASAPRAKASTRMKLKIAAKRKKIVRILKGKRTRRKSTSKRLAAMNKRTK
jgi:hypothetical protein